MSMRDHPITRRGLAIGTALAGAATAMASLVGCSPDEGNKPTGTPQVVDTTKVVNVLKDYKQADAGLTAAKTWNLPVGTVPFLTSGMRAAIMQAPESAVHVNTLGVLSLNDGTTGTVLDTPTLGKPYEFFDVRCSEQVMAWVEMNYLTGAWTLFGQECTASALTGKPTKLDSGGKNYQPAVITVSGASVIWYKMPSITGTRLSEHSYCRLWNLGDGQSPRTVYNSPGRFAAAPRVSGRTLTIVPRVKEQDGTYYGLTAINLDDSNLTQVAQLVLPVGVSPFDAVYNGKSFAFSIEAAYNGVGALGQMGTFIGREGGPYVYFSREPTAPVTSSGSRYLIKSQSGFYVVDTDKKTYGAIASTDRALDFGDYPASEGETKNFLTFATVRDDQGIPSNVTMKLYSL